MSDANALLISQAGALRSLWGVEKLSLCLPATDETDTVIVHGQPDAAVPEMTDPETARNALDAFPAGAAPVARFQGNRPGRYLFRVTRLLGGDRSGEPVQDFYSSAFTAVTFWIGIDAGLKAPPDLVSLSIDGGPTPRVLDFTAELVWFCRRAAAVMRDPVTQLPGRSDFQSTLTQAIRRAKRAERPLSVLLVNPDDLIHVNRRFGRAAGDTVVREIAERLEEATGHSHRVHRYGGAIFTVTLEDAPPAVVSIVAERLIDRLSGAPYLGGELRLGFCIGIAHLDPEMRGGSSKLAQGLVQRADSALGDAKRAGKGPIEIWGPEAEHDNSVHHDRLVGIFTADQSKDYRNMLLLWDMVRLVAESPDRESLAPRAVDHLAAAFEPARVALIVFSGHRPEILAAVARRRPGASETEPFALVDLEAELVERARQEGVMQESEPPHGGRILVAPLASDRAMSMETGEHSKILGALLLAIGDGETDLDGSDRLFLDALAGQIAAALDRIYLAERESRREAEERRRLEAEVQELRVARRRVELVHRSPQMAEVLDVVRRVAPTDVTVLVSGESGSGKEVVARLVHEMSPRRERQPIVVDCGAIASSLIDSELFGHEKGAYTGAERRSLGRLAEADGGTLILDEIGELPLEVQSKLLRFVQDRQLTPVGANRPRTVDARLIAVTHRNLAAEVAAGRFRGDLYHRLNVVHLKVPPLSRRPDDVIALTEFFLRRFAERYRKPIHGLTPQAEERVRSYKWPGNVRELENRLLRAVILCEGQLIDLQELGLADHQSGALTADKIHAAMLAAGGRLPPAPTHLSGPESVNTEADRLGTPPPPAAGPSASRPMASRRPALDPSARENRVDHPNGSPQWTPEPPTFSTPPSIPPVPEAHTPNRARPLEPTPTMAVDAEGSWAALRRELQHQVSVVGEVRPPLGTWLIDDLLLAADVASNGIAGRGATLLGMPETTYRRRLQQAKESSPHRLPQWLRMASHLSGLLSHGFGSADLPGRLRKELLIIVVETLGDDVSGGAALMGISPPTYRRWRKEL